MNTSMLKAPESGQMGFCLGSAKIGNRAAFETLDSEKAAVEQICRVCCGQGLHSGPGQPDSLENLASRLVTECCKETRLLGLDLLDASL